MDINIGVAKNHAISMEESTAVKYSDQYLEFYNKGSKEMVDEWIG